ncbi:MAG: hypothetical protein B6U78_00080 [Candidatus Aenigmarchaeota archaeon ex4484_224]|nr:MAG: hypothetical protein B6U78_00080 [Candidatus Aenigmarchaeota archaeon ex4484_224]
MRKLSNYKGQFFILSAVVIIGAMYLISKQIIPLRMIDISQIALDDEIFVFNNIYKKSIEVVKKSKDCNDLSWNLEEFKNFVEDYGVSKGMKIVLNYNILVCNSVQRNVSFELYLNSSRYKLYSQYFG